MAPAQSKSSGKSNEKIPAKASTNRKPPPQTPLDTIIFSTETDDESAPGNNNVTSASVEAAQVLKSKSFDSTDEKASEASKSKGSNNTNEKGSHGDSSASTPTSAGKSEKIDKYASLLDNLKESMSPRSAKKKRVAKKKRAFPAPRGNGKINQIYTVGTADRSSIAFVMHKKNPNEGAFTKPVDDQMRKTPAIKEAFGIDNIFLRVNPENGSEYYAIPYTNRAKEEKTKYFMVYHRKSNNTSKEKCKKWA